MWDIKSVVWLSIISLVAPYGLYIALLSWSGLGGMTYLLLLVIIYAVTFFFMPYDKEITWPIVLLTLLALIYHVSSLLSNPIALAPRTREAVVAFYVLVFVYLLAGRVQGLCIRYRLDKSMLLKGMLLSASITALIGVAQLLSILPKFDTFPGLGMTGHKNAYGYSCAIGVVLSLMLTSCRYSSASSYWIPLAGAVSLLGLVFSLSRGAWLATLVSFAIFILLKKNIAIKFVLIGIAVMFLMLVATLPDVQDRLYSHDISTGRFFLWEQLYPVTAHEYIFGQGAGFMWSLTQYDINQWGGYVSDENDSIYAHNDYLFLLIECGILLPVIWLWFNIVHVLKALVGITVGDGAEQDMGLIILVFICALFISQNVDTVFFGARNVVYFVIVISAASKLINHDDTNL